MSFGQRVRRWLPLIAVVAWAALIYSLSSRSHVAVTDDPFWDLVTRKTAHLVAFAVLAFLAAASANALHMPRPLVIGFAVAVIYAVLDEVHQGFVVGRTPLVTDVLIDAAGALLGVAAWRYLSGRTASSAV